MPNIKEYAATFRDWDGLIGACDSSPDLMPGGELLLQDLESFLALVRDLKVEQESLMGQRKAISQRLSRSVVGGREAARKLRRFIQTRLDSDDERLTQFGIAPIRSRRRKAIDKPPVEDPPPSPEIAKAAAAGKQDGSPGDH